tara:strand:+ start:3736 stop:4572 length:837 start_codon:yes stop_codon:yes gene_type:complete
MSGYQIQNQLGQQSADMNELRLNGWKTQTFAFKTLDGREQDKKDADIQQDAESDVTKVDQVYKVGKATGRAAAGAALVASKGGTLSEAGSVAGKAFAEVGEGTKLFETARFGSQGVTAVKDLTGVEGVVSGVLLKGGGETFAKVGAKGLGAVGAGIALYQDADNFFDTGNVFKKKDAAGTIVTQNVGMDIGNVATVIGGALDIATAFTGGALAPLAAAVNIFAAVDSAISGIKQDSDDRKADEKDAPPKKPPAATAPASFAQFGIVANQSHNPLDHIS